MEFMGIIIMILGLIGLWLGSRWIMSAAIGLANRFNLSHTFIGVGVLAIGTDLPEMFISVKASILQLQGVEASGIISGNAIGSCLGQMSLILGISALFLRFTIMRSDLILNGIILILTIALVSIFGMNGKISRFEGGVLVVVYILYYILLLKLGSKDSSNNPVTKQTPILKIVVLFLIGFSVLILSSHLVVENAMKISEKFGLMQSFVGILIVGIGTSLPELAVSVSAARRKSAGMSIGNIIGSNIFDGLIPIGLGGLVSTTRIEQNLLVFDLPFLLGITMLAIIFLARKGISKIEGIILLLLFAIYVAIKMWLFASVE